MSRSYEYWVTTSSTNSNSQPAIHLAGIPLLAANLFLARASLSPFTPFLLFSPTNFRAGLLRTRFIYAVPSAAFSPSPYLSYTTYPLCDNDSHGVPWRGQFKHLVSKPASTLSTGLGSLAAATPRALNLSSTPFCRSRHPQPIDYISSDG